MSFKNLSLGNYTVTVSTDRMYQKTSELEALVENLILFLHRQPKLLREPMHIGLGMPLRLSEQRQERE